MRIESTLARFPRHRLSLLYKHGLDYRVYERGLHICIYQQ